MKKLIALLLCCTAFAYDGERLVFDVPEGMKSLYEEGDSGHYHQVWSVRSVEDQVWTGEEGYFAVTSLLHDEEGWEGEGPLTVERFLEFYHDAEIIERSTDGVTLFNDWETVRLMITESCFHILKYHQTDLKSWLPYISNAHVGIPLQREEFYKSTRLQHPQGEEWAFVFSLSSQKNRSESWDHVDQVKKIFIVNELQKDSIDNFYSGHTTAWNECQADVVICILEESESEMLLQVEIDEWGMVFFERLIVTPETRHIASIDASLAEATTAIASIKALSLI